MDIWAIIPVKRLDHAKSRLAPVLSRSERDKLAYSMFCDVLDTLSDVTGLSGILVVTNDVRAEAVAQGAGAVVLPDLAEDGTNRAVKYGLEWLRNRKDASAVILPGDVPFTTSAEISAIIGELKNNALVIVPAARDWGTNVLAMATPDTIQIAFGEDSFSRHLDAARKAGIEPRVLQLDGAGHDIDVPADLVCDAAGGLAPRTRSLLQHFAQRTPPSVPLSLRETLQP